uniref:hypothetical protein n=1 Tax=Pseudomonas sp. JAI120 TaxID=2723063 RepID=UPI0030DA399E
NGSNVYEAVVHHLRGLARDGRKAVLASYSTGARERLAGLLKDHGATNLKLVDTWQEALGASAPLPLAGGAGGGRGESVGIALP